MKLHRKPFVHSDYVRKNVQCPRTLGTNIHTSIHLHIFNMSRKMFQLLYFDQASHHQPTVGYISTLRGSRPYPIVKAGKRRRCMLLS